VFYRLCSQCLVRVLWLLNETLLIKETGKSYNHLIPPPIKDHSCFMFWNSWIQISARKSVILKQFCDFPQYLPKNTETLHHITSYNSESMRGQLHKPQGKGKVHPRTGYEGPEGK
jgi:hypothetical protein